MIYCSLENRGATALAVRDLFSNETADPSADFDTAIQNPLKEIPSTSAQVNLKKSASANQGVWLDAGQLSGHDGVTVPGLTVCAAVLFYDEDFHLIGAGHAGGGIIGDFELETINTAIRVSDVQYVVYATPSFQYNTDDYKTYVSNLTQLFDTSTICIVDGFGTVNMGMVIGDMMGNVVFSS